MARAFVRASSEFLQNSATPPVTVVPLTLACWLKPTSTAGDQAAVAIDDNTFGASSDSFILFSTSTHQARCQAWGAGTAGGATTTAVGTINVFGHLCGVFTSATARAVYLNGGNKITSAVSKTPGTLTEMTIGRYGSGAGGFVFADAEIAEAAIWNVALTDAEVAVLGSTTTPVSPLFVRPQSLVMYAPLLSGSSPEPDIKGARNFTLSGSTVVTHPRIFYPSRHQKFRFKSTQIPTIDSWFDEMERPPHLQHFETIGV